MENENKYTQQGNQAGDKPSGVKMRSLFVVLAFDGLDATIVNDANIPVTLLWLTDKRGMYFHQQKRPVAAIPST